MRYVHPGLVPLKKQNKSKQTPRRGSGAIQPQCPVGEGSHSLHLTPLLFCLFTTHELALAAPQSLLSPGEPVGAVRVSSASLALCALALPLPLSSQLALCLSGAPVVYGSLMCCNC